VFLVNTYNWTFTEGCTIALEEEAQVAGLQ
jgi:hypothetical protein